MECATQCAFTASLPLRLEKHDEAKLASSTRPVRVRRRQRRRAEAPEAQRQVCISARTDLASVKRALPLSEYFRGEPHRLELRSRGNAGDWMCCCPFHKDDTPSLSISDTRGVFYCFGCGAQGDLFDAERLTYNLSSFRDSLASLGSRYPSVRNLIGVSSSAPRAPVQPVQMQEAPVPQPVDWRALVDGKQHVRHVLARTIAFYRATLQSDVGEAARTYLVKRGISERTVRAYQIGYGGPPELWTYALEALCVGADAIPVEWCMQAGVVSTSKNESHYDTFRGRLILPVFDASGRLVAVAGRLLQPTARAPKYINSRESPLFRKKEVLFGAHMARDALAAVVPPVEVVNLFEPAPKDVQPPFEDMDDYVRQEREKEIARNPNAVEDMLANMGESPVFEMFTGVRFTRAFLVVVEGYLDVLALHEHSKGTFPAVAAMGTAVSVEQVRAALELLPDPLECTVVFNFDNDDAGFRAAERLCDSVLTQVPQACRVAIAFPPDNVKDVDEFLNEAGGTAEQYMQHVRSTAMLWPRWRGQRIVEEEMEAVVSQMPQVSKSPPGREYIQQMIDAINTGRSLKRPTPNDDIERLVVDGLPTEYNHKSAAVFSSQVADQLSRASDRMMVSFGAPKKILKERQKKFTLDVRPQVVERLAQLLAAVERINPGCNSSELLLEWSDTLCHQHMDALHGLFFVIARRVDEINKDNMPPSEVWDKPPWEVDEMSRFEKKKHEELEDYEGVGKDPRRLKAITAQITRQRQTVEKEAEARRCTRQRRFLEFPRVGAEERLLRAMVRCRDEMPRLKLLEQLIEVMLDIEENEGRFWTERWRRRMFDKVARLDGDLEVEDVAAACYCEEWWCDEAAALFEDDDPDDHEWADIMRRDLERPVEAALAAAKSVAAMERRVRGRSAATELAGNILQLGALRATDPDNFDVLDDTLARQMVLRRYLQDASSPTEEEKARTAKAVRDQEEEAERRRLINDVAQMIKEGKPVPYEFVAEERRIDDDDAPDDS